MTKNKENFEKYAPDLERYETIVNYFENNPYRINANMDNLNYLYDSQLSGIHFSPNSSDLKDRCADILYKIGKLTNNEGSK